MQPAPPIAPPSTPPTVPVAVPSSPDGLDASQRDELRSLARLHTAVIVCLFPLLAAPWFVGRGMLYTYGILFTLFDPPSWPLLRTQIPIAIGNLAAGLAIAACVLGLVISGAARLWGLWAAGLVLAAVVLFPPCTIVAALGVSIGLGRRLRSRGVRVGILACRHRSGAGWRGHIDSALIGCVGPMKKARGECRGPLCFCIGSRRDYGKMPRIW